MWFPAVEWRKCDYDKVHDSIHNNACKNEFDRRIEVMSNVSKQIKLISIRNNWIKFL